MVDPPAPGGESDIPRRLRLRPHQWIGIPLLMLMPALAAVGALNERRVTTTTANDAFQVKAEYADRLRYSQRNVIMITVSATRAITDTITVEFDAEVFDQFPEVELIPEGDAAYRVALAGIPAGQGRTVRATIKGGPAGKHHGRVTISAPASEMLELPLIMRVLP